MPSLRLEKAGRLIRLRGDSISPGLRIHSPGLQIHAHTACRVPLPLSPISDEEVDDGGCAGVSRGRLTQGDMANADRSSRPSLPYPPEVWPSQPARRSERAYSDATHRILLPYLPVYRPPLPHTLVSDCTVPCRYVVHTGYAYPSALLWADLLSNKVGPSQKNASCWRSYTRTVRVRTHKPRAGVLRRPDPVKAPRELHRQPPRSATRCPPT